MAVSGCQTDILQLPNLPCRPDFPILGHGNTPELGGRKGEGTIRECCLKCWCLDQTMHFVCLISFRYKITQFLKIPHQT